MPFDFAAITAPFRMQPGLRRVGPSSPTLSALDPGSAVFAQKLGVLARHADQALVSVPAFDAVPALRALAAQAASECPGAVAWDGESVRALRLGLGVTLAGGSVAGGSAMSQAAVRPDAHAVVAALPQAWRAAAVLGLALRADFAIVDGPSGHVPWIAACLPSHWDPREKVGRHFTEIHGPVPDNATLLAAGAHLMRLVCEPQRWERFVWTLTAEPSHDRHPSRIQRRDWPAGLQREQVPAVAQWRTEHQGFIPVPERGQAVFTIEVEVQPIGEAITRADRARQVAEALATMSPGVLEYRGLTAARDALVAWLRWRGAQEP